MKLLISISLYFCCLLSVYANSIDNGIRAYPYPFANSVSFASDVDAQTVDEGSKFHQLVNSRLGLPISDSLWVKTNVESLSGIFGPDYRLNEYLTKDGLPAYFSLLREWHRGHIDHFHSWQSDAEPIYRYEFPAGTKFSKNGTRVDIDWPGVFFADADNITLITQSRLPESSTIKFALDRSEIDDGSNFASFLVSDAIVQRNKNRNGLFSYSWSNRTSTNKTKILDQVRVRHPISIQIENLNCTGNCEIGLVELVFSDFSRRDVLETVGWLQDNGIYPTYITSHGGRTHLQNYVEVTRETVRSFPKPLDDPNVDPVNIVSGNRSGYFSYHTDLLRGLGVRALWTWDDLPLRASSVSANEVSGLRNVKDTNFYSVDRTTIFGVDIKSKEGFVDSLGKIFTDVGNRAALDLVDFYCGATCNFSQGDMVDLLVAITLDQNSSRVGHELFWYTHFGSGGDKGYNRSADMPFDRNVLDWFAKLSDKYYSNSRGKISSDNAIWVQSASTYINYLINRPYVLDNTIVDRASNSVSISSWQDEINGLRLPDPFNPSSSLHGFTFQVNSPSDAAVFVDGVELKYLMPAYDHAESSTFVTVVDTSTPTSLIPGSNTDKFLIIDVPVGEYRSCEQQSSCSELEFTGTNGGTVHAEVSFKAPISVFNSPYVLLKLSENTDLNKLRDLEVVIQMVSGEKVAVSSRATDSFDGAKLNIDLGFLKTKGYFIAPLYLSSWAGDTDCNFETRSGCDIPYGVVEKISIRAKLDGEGSIVGLSELAFLRPNPSSSNTQKPDYVSIAGRALPHEHFDKDDYWVVMTDPISSEQRQVKVSQHGVFSFSNVRRNIAVELKLVRESDGIASLRKSGSNDLSLVQSVKNFFSDIPVINESKKTVDVERKVDESCFDLDQRSAVWVWVERYTADIEIPLVSPEACS